MTTLQYGNEIEHPWPTVFRFKLELLAEEGATAAEIDHVYRHVAVDPQVDCVVNLLVTDPVKLLATVNKMGLEEGVVSKGADAPYRSGTLRDWVKVKARTWREANADRWELLQR